MLQVRTTRTAASALFMTMPFLLGSFFTLLGVIVCGVIADSFGLLVEWWPATKRAPVSPMRSRLRSEHQRPEEIDRRYVHRSQWRMGHERLRDDCRHPS